MDYWINGSFQILFSINPSIQKSTNPFPKNLAVPCSSNARQICELSRLVKDKVATINQKFGKSKTENNSQETSCCNYSNAWYFLQAECGYFRRLPAGAHCRNSSTHNLAPIDIAEASPLFCAPFFQTGCRCAFILCHFFQENAKQPGIQALHFHPHVKVDGIMQSRPVETEAKRKPVVKLRRVV